MSPEREEVCKKCSMKPSIHHLEYPSCNQEMYPINEEEWKALGAGLNDEITVESLRRMMEISIRPYCLEKMLTAHPIEWWLRNL